MSGYRLRRMNHRDHCLMDYAFDHEHSRDHGRCAGVSVCDKVIQSADRQTRLVRKVTVSAVLCKTVSDRATAAADDPSHSSLPIAANSLPAIHIT